MYFIREMWISLYIVHGYCNLSFLLWLLGQTSADPCVSLAATDSTQFVTSHVDYGMEEYSTRINSCWQIFALNMSYVVKLKEEEFSLEKGGPICAYDYLAVYNGPTVESPTLGSFCGRKGPGTRYSDQQYLTLHFQSDATFNDKGFKLAYSRIHEDDIPAESNNLHAGSIIGIVFVCIVLAVVVLVVVVLCIKNKYRKVHAATNRGCQSRPQTSTTRTLPGGNNSSVGYIVPQIQPVAPPPYAECLSDNNTDIDINGTQTGSASMDAPPSYRERGDTLHLRPSENIRMHSLPPLNTSSISQNTGGLHPPLNTERLYPTSPPPPYSVF